MKLNSCFSAIGAVLCLATHTVPAAAQQTGAAAAYPTKPIRLIVPLAPGGPSDTLARMLAQKLGEGMKQMVIVDNRPGAGSVVGIGIAAKSPPDGYTMILVSTSYSVNAALYSELPYDMKDLTAVTMLAVAPNILVAHPSLPVKTLKQLIALAKARPGELNYASGGNGTASHMEMELLKLQTGINIVHIPYKGAGPSMIDLIAGHVQLLMPNIIVALPVVKSGRARAIAVSTAKRSSAASEIPTIAESGVPGYDEGGQHGIMVPAGTPRDIVTRLHQEITKILQLSEVKDRLASEGAEVVGNSPEQYMAIIRSDVEKWARVVRSSGIRAD